MDNLKVIGRWKYFVISYLLIATCLITYFSILDNVPQFIISAIILFGLIHIVITARNPIIKIEDQHIRLVYPFKEKIILKKDVIKIEPISGIFFSYFLLTNNDKFFLLLNPFMIYINSWTSTQSYAENITSILKGYENS